MKKLKIGIIGTGSISNFHISGYKALGDKVELYAMCDINEERVKAMAAKHGVTRVFTDVDTMLAECPELDAVSVCTWNAAHHPCTMAALKAGKHVLCEKPMAISAEQAREMQAAAEENGVVLMVGFVRRFGNDCTVLKDFIEAGELGDIYYAKATYLRRHGNPGGWFGDKSRSGGGPLIDLGVHVIDLVRYLCGNHKPVSVYGATFNKLGNRDYIKSKAGYIASSGGTDICDVEDLASVMIRFDNGTVLQIEASFDLNIKTEEGVIQLFGSNGGAKLSPELELFTVDNGYMVNKSLYNSTALSFDGLFENEIAHFVSCAAEGTPCRAPAEDGVTLMDILDAAYESARTGHEVVLAH